MRLPRSLHDEMVEVALGDAPHECCGMLAARDGEPVQHYPCVNAAASVTRYEIDGFDQHLIFQEMQRRGLTLWAVYHSHTVAPPYPSEMDIATAAYPDALQLIVSVQDPDRPELRGFWIRDGQVSEEPLEVRG